MATMHLLRSLALGLFGLLPIGGTAQSEISTIIGTARDSADMNRLINVSVSLSRLGDGDSDEKVMNMQAFPSWIRTGWVSCVVRGSNRSGRRSGELRCTRNDQFVASAACSRSVPRSSMTISDPDNLYRFYLSIQCQ
jgi:hypothetical protein